MANMTIAVAFVVIALLASAKIITMMSSPLNAIPNAHFTAPFSSIWIRWIRAQGKEFTTRLAAHHRLGPIIRLGPQEVGINCLEEGVRTVYGKSWDKTKMYNMFANYGFLPLFAISEAKPHAERKRVFSHVFQKSTISNSVEFRSILDVIGHDRLRPRLQRLARSSAIENVFSMTREYSMDVVTAYTYGIEKGTNWLDNPAQAAYYLSAFRDTVTPSAFLALSEIPWVVEIFHQFGISIISPSFLSSLKIVQKFVFDLTLDVIRPLQDNYDSETSFSQPFHHIWSRLHDMPDSQKVCLLASDAFDQLHAGHESTGILLTYIMWELSKNSGVQNKLRYELRSLRNTGHPAEKSQFLDHIVMETLRVYPAAGGPFGRVAPPNAKLAGYQIPTKTTVNAVPYTLGRNSEVFCDPDSWIPERWSEANDEERRRMKEWVWAFISGSRICIAEYLAMRIMKAFIAEVYSDYSTEVAVESDMRQLQTFFAVPAESALYLKFEAC